VAVARVEQEKLGNRTERRREAGSVRFYVTKNAERARDFADRVRASRLKVLEFTPASDLNRRSHSDCGTVGVHVSVVWPRV
jgi:hypothetical protein